MSVTATIPAPRAPLPHPWRLTRPVAVVWRTPTALQVGLDDDRSLVLPDAPPGAEALLRALGRGHSGQALAEDVPGVDPGWVTNALARLEAHGLLRRGPTPAQRPVALFGTGPVAEAVAGLLAGEGLDLLVVEPGRSACPEAIRSAARRWTAVVRRHRRTARVQLVEPWRAEAEDPPLALVCGPAIEPDRSLTDALAVAGLPHLVVRCEPDRAVVGPFVLPGRTSCVRCSDLQRGRRDPQWPHLLAQLCHERPAASVLLRHWAAATAAAQALAFLAGAVPESVDATLELAGAAHVLQVRAWAPDPACGCCQPGWSARTASTAAP